MQGVEATSTRVYLDVWGALDGCIPFENTLREVYPRLGDAWKLREAICNGQISELDPRVIESMATCLSVPTSMIDERLPGLLTARVLRSNIDDLDRRLVRLRTKREEAERRYADVVASLDTQARALLEVPGSDG